MRIYHASGFSIMNNEGREKVLAKLFNPYRRLYSFFDKERQNGFTPSWKSLIKLAKKNK